MSLAVADLDDKLTYRHTDLTLDATVQANIFGPEGLTAARPRRGFVPGPVRLHGIMVNNKGSGTPTAVYLRLWDAINPDGTADAPDYIFHVPANVSAFYPMNMPDGEPFAVLSLSCTKLSAPGDVTDPDTEVTVRLFHS